MTLTSSTWSTRCPKTSRSEKLQFGKTKTHPRFKSSLKLKWSLTGPFRHHTMVAFASYQSNWSKSRIALPLSCKHSQLTLEPVLKLRWQNKRSPTIGSARITQSFTVARSICSSVTWRTQGTPWDCADSESWTIRGMFCLDLMCASMECVSEC